MSQVPTNSMSVAQPPDPGNPFLQMIGTFLPMMFGLPLMPQLGQVLAGGSPGMPGPQMSQSGMSGVNPFNPYADQQGGQDGPFSGGGAPPTAAESWWSEKQQDPYGPQQPKSYGGWG